MTMVVSEMEIVPSGMLSSGFGIRAALFAEDLGSARGVLKAVRANERSSHSPIRPAATRAAPRATTGAACCQRAGVAGLRRAGRLALTGTGRRALRSMSWSSVLVRNGDIIAQHSYAVAVDRSSAIS